MSEVPNSAQKTPNKRKKYSIELKIEVAAAEYAIKHNNVAASRHFFINESGKGVVL